MKRTSRWQLIWNIPRLLQTSWLLIKNPRVSGQKKTLLALLGLGYLFFPFDLIADIFPLLGQLDDLSVLFFLLNWFVNRAQPTDDLEADYYISEENKPKK